MTEMGLLQIALYMIVLLACVQPLGWYMARVYQGEPCGLNQLLGGLEKLFYRFCSIDASEEMSWKKYLSTMLVFNGITFLFVYVLQRMQFHLPLNPQAFSNVSPDLAFNTAASFITNTNWQLYAGETTMSYLSQMLGLTVLNFISAATGMSLLMALIRGISRRESSHLGNFWIDTVRGVLYILLPLSLMLSVALASLGVIQNFKSYQTVSLMQPVRVEGTSTSGQTLITQQVLPMGPVASQVAIKQLGTNGGGFFNANSAHPFENPTPLTNFLEMLAILLIPAAFCCTFGIMVEDRRQGYAILVAMLIMFIPMLVMVVMAEQAGNPALTALGVDPVAHANAYSGGNMEGKETRFGIVSSALWAAATTAASNGSVNAMLDSFMPLGGMVPLWLMHLGEVIFGGVGSGLYGMLMLVIITVFITGLMVGRTPEYLGKKIEPYEMKMASIAVLVMPMSVLISTAMAAISVDASGGDINPGAHGFTEMLYMYTSLANNNGSAFAGFQVNSIFNNIAGGLMMLISRFWIAIPAIAIAGSLARKKQIPSSTGTMATHTPLFIAMLVFVTFIIGALSFLPALALGPIVEHLMLWGQYGR